MSFFAYLYQLRVNIKKYFHSNKTIPTKQEKSQCAQEVKDYLKNDLSLKCKKAAQEIQYIKNFSHWPMTEAKKKLEKNAIVYLDVNRKKRTTVIPNNHEGIKVISSMNTTSVIDKVVVIKKRH